MGHRDGLLVTQTYLSRLATTAPLPHAKRPPPGGYVLTHLSEADPLANIRIGFRRLSFLFQLLFQLANPLLQESPLWFLLGQRQSFLIRRPSLSRPAEPAAHIGTGGMCKVIIG